MAIIYVGAGTPSSSEVGSTSATVTVASTTPGDVNLMVIVTVGEGDLDPGAVSAPGWIAVGATFDSGSPGARISVLRRSAQFGDPAQVTFTWPNAGKSAAGCVAYRGVDPIDPTPSYVLSPKSGLSADFPTGSLTTGKTGWLVMVAGTSAPGSFTMVGATRGTSQAATGPTLALSDSAGIAPPGTYSYSATLSAEASVGAAGMVLLFEEIIKTVAAPPDLTGVDGGDEVSLTATVTGTTTASWRQVSGSPVTIRTSGATGTFQAPLLLAPETITLRAIAGRATDDVSVTIEPARLLRARGATHVPCRTLTGSQVAAGAAADPDALTYGVGEPMKTLDTPQVELLADGRWKYVIPPSATPATPRRCEAMWTVDGVTPWWVDDQIVRIEFTVNAQIGPAADSATEDHWHVLAQFYGPSDDLAAPWDRFVKHGLRVQKGTIDWYGGDAHPLHQWTEAGSYAYSIPLSSYQDGADYHIVIEAKCSDHPDGWFSVWCNGALWPVGEKWRPRGQWRGAWTSNFVGVKYTHAVGSAVTLRTGFYRGTNSDISHRPTYQQSVVTRPTYMTPLS